MLRVARRPGPSAYAGPAELDRVRRRSCLPGGESTTMAKLARTFELFDPIRKRIAGGMPTLRHLRRDDPARRPVVDGAAGQETFGGLDVTVRRNAFGRQVDSFEGDIAFEGMAGHPCTPCSSGRRGWSRPVPGWCCCRYSFSVLLR